MEQRQIGSFGYGVPYCNAIRCVCVYNEVRRSQRLQGRQRISKAVDSEEIGPVGDASAMLGGKGGLRWRCVELTARKVKQVW